MSNKKTVVLVQFSVLFAIEAIFCFTPLGSLPAMGPIVATLSMLPVIITAQLLGPKAGSLMGFFFGMFSFIVWTFMPPFAPAAFVFTPLYTTGEFSGNFGSLIICFVPRILIGTVAGLICKNTSGKTVSNSRVAFSAALGSLVNTFGVLGGIWVFFANEYASVAGDAILAIIGTTILTSGIPEAVVSAVAATAVYRAVKSSAFK